MVSVLTIQQESFYSMWGDAEALRQQNHNEAPIAVDGLPLNIDVNFYKKGYTAGVLIIHTAREGSKLCGYHFSWLNHAPHFSLLGGYSDAYYVLPEYRGAGVGKKLLQAAESSWASSGAKLGFIACRTEEQTNYTPAFIKLGWKPNELTFVKRIGQ